MLVFRITAPLAGGIKPTRMGIHFVKAVLVKCKAGFRTKEGERANVRCPLFLIPFVLHLPPGVLCLLQGELELAPAAGAVLNCRESGAELFWASPTLQTDSFVVGFLF